MKERRCQIVFGRCVNILLCIISFSGCSKKESKVGLPASGQWDAPQMDVSEAARENKGDTAQPQAHADATDPHAGLDLKNYIADGALAGDPHKGLLGDSQPHGGLENDPDMAKYDPPDPNRIIDSKKYLKGQINLGKEFQTQIPADAVVFISIRPIDKITGDIIGSPLAVDIKKKLDWPLSFRLTEEHMMVAGTEFKGDVEVYARVDADGEARTKEPGDIEGFTRATIPAKDLVVKLDSRLR